MRKSGNQVRITAQLIDARSDTHLWSETYDRTLDDIFAVQDEIAAAVVEQLKITLLGAAPKAKADRSGGLRALPAGPPARAARARRGVRAIHRAVPAGAGDRSGLRGGVGRAGQQLPAARPARSAPDRGGLPPGPRGGGQGAGDRPGLRAGPCPARLDRDEPTTATWRRQRGTSSTRWRWIRPISTSSSAPRSWLKASAASTRPSRSVNTWPPATR